MLNNEPHEPKSHNYNNVNSKKSYPLIAGILLIISSALAFLTGIVLIFYGLMISGMSNLITSNESYMPSTIPGYNASDLGLSFDFMQTFFYICAIVIIVLALFALLGGIMSIRKKMWGLALAGSILGLFTIGPLFLSSILALIALIFIVISRDQFEKKQQIDTNLD
jgi:hypothetical protein